jgi:glutathione S-transferase
MYKLIIANKAYSSWSFRPWLLMKQFNIAFEDMVIPMYLSDSAAKLAPYSDNGKVPVLFDGDIKIWESLAIFEYLHEKHSVWAKDPAARAHSRAISNEMHASFGAMRELLTCNFRRAPKRLALPDNVQKDVDRIVALWSEARSRFGKNGAFLYGEFSAADAMYAPVVSRFHVYDVEVPADIKTYMQTMMALPAWREWEEAGQKEPWHYDFYERN